MVFVRGLQNDGIGAPGSDMRIVIQTNTAWYNEMGLFVSNISLFAVDRCVLLAFIHATASAFAFCGRRVVMNCIGTEELQLSLCLKWKSIIINKSYISEKMSHGNRYSDEEQSNNILKISMVVSSAVYEKLNLACSVLFRKGKALFQWFPAIQTNVPFSEKYILLHNKGQRNALISHWNCFTATVGAHWKWNLPIAIKI